jgi:hypothetical protein
MKWTNKWTIISITKGTIIGTVNKRRSLGYYISSERWFPNIQLNSCDSNLCVLNILWTTQTNLRTIELQSSVFISFSNDIANFFFNTCLFVIIPSMRVECCIVGPKISVMRMCLSLRSPFNLLTVWTAILAKWSEYRARTWKHEQMNNTSTACVCVFVFICHICHELLTLELIDVFAT